MEIKEGAHKLLSALLQYPHLVKHVVQTVSPSSLPIPYGWWLEAFHKSWGEHKSMNQPFICAEVAARGQTTLTAAGAWWDTLDLSPLPLNAVENLTDLVAQATARKQLQGLADSIGAQLKTEVPPQRICAEAFRTLSSLQTNTRDSLIYDSEELTRQLALEYASAAEHPNQLQGLSWGYPELDQLTSGLSPGDLIVIAARPSIGKTTFALNVAQRRQYRTLFFSLEMSPLQLMRRALDATVGTPVHDLIRHNELSRDILMAHLKKCREWGLYVAGRTNPSPEYVSFQSLRCHALYGIQLIILDYLQLMSLPSSMISRDREIAIISSTLKSIARECQIPVIVLSQLNRQVEYRKDQSPVLSDLRDSGAIEQDADVVAFLHGPITSSTLKVSIKKNRNGPLGETTLFYDRQASRISSLTTEDRNGQNHGPLRMA